MDGHVLYVDDPSRGVANASGKYGDVTFYYGTSDVDYLSLLCDIVQKFLSIHHISAEACYCISNSKGGYAALAITHHLSGANAIALSPQISIPTYFHNIYRESNAFESYFQIQFNKSLRFELYDIFDNTKSNFFIYANKASCTDRVQIEAIFNYVGATPAIGLQKINNVYIYISDIPAPYSHVTFPNEGLYQVMEKILLEGPSVMYVELLDGMMLEMKRYYGEAKDYMLKVMALGQENITQFLKMRAQLIKSAIQDCIHDIALKNFLLSPRKAIVYGAGHQAEILLTMCKIFCKPINCVLISEGSPSINLAQIPWHTIDHIQPRSYSTNMISS